MGRLIVIEGLDGSGKATQTELLAAALAARGQQPRHLSFPQYGTPACAPVEMYLRGEFGQNAGDVSCYAASVLYAVDRFASFRTDWRADYDKGALFVADRYTTSNAVYQAGKLPPHEWDGFLTWLFQFEYIKMGIPKPDLTIYLDVSADTSSALMTGRYDGDDSRRDIHERDIAFQRHCREAALYCAEKENWRVVRCDVDGAMRARDDIAAEVLDAVLSAGLLNKDGDG